MNTESTQTGFPASGAGNQNHYANSQRLHNWQPAPDATGEFDSPPRSESAEVSTLGCLLLDPAVAFPIAIEQGIGAGHFYDMRLGKLYCLMRKFYRERGNFDALAIDAAMRDADEYPGLDAQWLASVMNRVPCASNIAYYLTDLKDKRRRRFMREMAIRLNQVAVDTTVDSSLLLGEMVDQLQGMERVAARRQVTLRTPAEVLALPSDQQDNILGDRLLAKGQSLTMMGAGGIGKSRLLLQLAVACILQRPFVGMRTHAPGLRWLIFQAENSVRRLQMDLNALKTWAGDDWERVNQQLLIHTLEGAGDYFLNLDNAATRRRLSDLIEKHAADVVCFDPLNHFGVGDLNTDRDMRQTCQAITELTQSTNPNRAVVVLHHALTGKSGAARALGYERTGFGRNSKLLHAWTRGQINFAPGRPDDNSSLVLTCGKCSNGQEFEPYAVAMDADTMIYHEDHDFDLGDWQSQMNGGASAIEAVDHSELVREICQNLPTRRDLVEKIMARLQCSRSNAYNIVTRTAQKGRIQIEGKLVRNAA